MPPEKTTKKAIKDIETTFEARLQRLQEIVNLLEYDERPLEEAITLYQEGVMLAKTCQTQLDTARHTIEVLNLDGSIAPLPEQG